MGFRPAVYFFKGMFMSHSDCRCEILARSEVGHVAFCQGCGQVHLAVDYMTLRFDADAFRSLVSLVCRAQGQMDSAADMNKPAAPGAAIGSFH